MTACRPIRSPYRVALADKIDALVGFWAIDEKPTGSKDPYALRRAALGVIRILLNNNIRANLTGIFGDATEGYLDQGNTFVQESLGGGKGKSDLDAIKASFDALTGSELREFVADRLKVQLRDQGARHDLVDAVFALPGQDDVVAIVRRVEALGKFLDSEDGKNLLAGTKRAANILRIEEKKDSTSYTGAPDIKLLQQDEEKALAQAIGAAMNEAGAAIAQGRLRRRHERDGEAAPGRRCLLRQGHRQCRRQGVARKPPEAAQPDPRSDARGCGFLEDRGMSVSRGCDAAGTRSSCLHSLHQAGERRARHSRRPRPRTRTC